jgi:hypothetical protein
MKRIGIVASEISKGNLVLYNLYVILIAFLFSLFIFIIAGSTVVFAIAVIKYLDNEITGMTFEKSWGAVLSVCMVSLTVVITLFNVCAISMNLKLPKMKG